MQQQQQLLINALEAGKAALASCHTKLLLK
jgi:hypothetical protein